MDKRADVGRAWYVKITQGMVQAHVEFGTWHVTHGTQVWDSYIEGSLSETPTEREILDALYYAVSSLLERRTG